MHFHDQMNEKHDKIMIFSAYILKKEFLSIYSLKDCNDRIEI